jgi:hypothetical protein
LFKTDQNVIISCFRRLKSAAIENKLILIPPPRLQTLCGYAASVWMHPSFEEGSFLIFFNLFNSPAYGRQAQLPSTFSTPSTASTSSSTPLP